MAHNNPIKRLTGNQIDRIRNLIHQYPNTGPYDSDWVWRYILWPVDEWLYKEQNRRGRVIQVQAYKNYYKRLYRGQMLFHGPDGIPRSRKIA